MERQIESMDIQIETMIRSKQLLETIPIELQNGLYKNIIKQINSFIENYCNHQFIYDTIDINPDYSQTIQYCKKCYKTN